MHTCIYCREELDARLFNKEHVVPRQFGTFDQNQTLINTVCSSCNRYFSESIEHALGRDSFEAIFRLRHGQKLPAEFTGFKGERLAFRIPAGKPGSGVIVTPAASPDGSKIVLLLPPQVGVRREGQSEFRYFLEEEVRQDGPKILPGASKMTLRLVAAKHDETGLERLRVLVRSLVPKFQEDGEIDLPPPETIDGQIIVEIRGTIDNLIARAIAKIAFNYMAKHTGAAFALNSSFDSIRQFIRYDEGGGDWRQFVRIINEPLLAEEIEALKITRGHIVMLGWPNFRALQARVSPYNSIAYEVALTNVYSGIWRPIQIGHVFDWEQRLIHPLVNVSSVILRPGWARQAANAYAAMVRRDRRG